MALSLSSRDLSRLADLQETLLSPLEHETVEEWCLAVLRQAERLFRGDRSALMLPSARGVHYLSESIPSEYMERFERSIERFEPGALRFDDETVDRAWDLRRRRGLAVWSIPMLARLTGIPMDEVPMYHEVVKPAGLAHSAVATAPVSGGEAFLGVSHSRPGRAPLSEEQMLSLMRIVLPTFEAGVAALLGFEGDGASLATAVDRLGTATAVFTGPGEEVHRSRRLRELLEAEPERAVLEEQMRWLAAEAAAVRDARGDPSSGPVGRRDVATDTARYLLRAALAGRGAIDPGRAVLVSVERITPELPPKRTLVERHELTPRQAEVALLMARGLSNREIAERLGISRHTVRHHAEWVFTKLEIHSRKALALRLLGRGG